MGARTLKPTVSPSPLTVILGYAVHQKQASAMHLATLLSFLALAFIANVLALPVPYRLSTSLNRRLNITTPIGVGVDTGEDVGELSQISPIEDGFLEGDSDSGDGNDNGSTAASVANGLTGGGSASAANTNSSSGSTSSFCSKCSPHIEEDNQEAMCSRHVGLTSCTSAAQSANGNNTSTSASSSSPTLIGAPVVNGPLVDFGGKLKRWLRNL